MFWRVPSYSQASPLEGILDKQQFTLEELLDEEDLIQVYNTYLTSLVAAVGPESPDSFPSNTQPMMSPLVIVIINACPLQTTCLITYEQDSSGSPCNSCNGSVGSYVASPCHAPV